jgi:hypothetical protein
VAQQIINNPVPHRHADFGGVFCLKLIVNLLAIGIHEQFGVIVSANGSGRCRILHSGTATVKCHI